MLNLVWSRRMDKVVISRESHAIKPLLFHNPCFMDRYIILHEYYVDES